MKKRWKVFWIICIALAVLGSAFCISGLLLGATAAGVREILAGWSDDFYGYASSDTAEWAGESISGSYDMEVTEYAEDAEYIEYAAEEQDTYRTEHFSNVQELDVEVSQLLVWIEQTSNSEITVSEDIYDREIADQFSVSQDGEELKIRLKNRNKWDETHFIEDGARGTVTIGIPRGMRLQEISLKIGAGELNTGMLLTDELHIEIGAGTVFIEDFTAEKFKLECGAGDANITGDAQKEVKIECGIGTVYYYASGGENDYNYELECGMGSLDVGSYSCDGLGRERKVDNGSDRKMKIECGIGAVDVVFEE